MWDLIVVGTISTSTVKSSENQVSATNGSVHSLNSTKITKASTSLLTKEVVTKEGGKGKGWLKVEGEDGEWSCQQLKLSDKRGSWFTLSKV